MNILKSKLILYVALTVLVLLFPSYVFAAEKDQNIPSITVINLIRSKELGHEKDDLVQSLKDQYKVTKDSDVNAAWLFQYSALEDKEMMGFAKNQMEDQEFGLLFEIDKNFAQKSNVAYKGQGPWYFSDGLLLVSYDTSERTKLIDTAFLEFKKVFGYHPKTVGAWWIGGDSLTYMQEKYGITSTLRASDQFNLDFYTIWGTPWSIPYISSKQNQGVPAKSYDESTKVVNLQWAARDPLRGYSDATFSTQDYFLHSLDLSYVEHLSSTYMNNSLGNLVIGLENGGTLKDFEGFYKEKLIFAKNLEKDKKAEILLAKDYAQKFLNSKNIFSQNYFLYNDFDSDNQSFWYHSPNYRINITWEKGVIDLNDFRDYSKNLNEDFYNLPNTNPRLIINKKPIVDSMYSPSSKVGLVESNESLKINEENGKVILYSGNNEIARFYDDAVYFPKNDQYSQEFGSQRNYINLFLIILLVYLLYVFSAHYFTKNKKKLIYGLLLFIPLAFAYSFLGKGFEIDTTFIFDKKEVLLFYFLPFPFSNSIEKSLLILQAFPFLSLLLSHVVLIVKSDERYKKFIYLIIIASATFLYLHIPYFPLDSSTLKIVTIIFGVLALFLFILSIVIFWIKKSVKLFAVSLLISLLIIISFGVTVAFSRAKLVLVPFEQEALQFVQDSGKNVLYVEQKDYGIGPIYKSLRPLLYENQDVAEKITRVDWEKTLRPKNHILNISGYNDKLIYVPRYLGSDISDYEIDKLNIKKVFDNGQIVIFRSV